MSNKNRVLVVVHANHYDRIKIISARKAGKKERKQYKPAWLDQIFLSHPQV